LKASHAKRNIACACGSRAISISVHRSVREAASRVHEERARNAGLTPENRTREVGFMAAPQPGIGNWYRLKESGSLFEVVALDDDDGTIEIQYFDGTVEEMDVEDWEGQWDDGALERAEAPEDWSGSVDVEPDEDNTRRGDAGDGDRDLRASPLDGIDLFD
jgi:hypothetical protein